MDGGLVENQELYVDCVGDEKVKVQVVRIELIGILSPDLAR